MPILKSNVVAAEIDPRLARTLWQWLVLGALAVTLLPAARGASPWIGSLPLWLLGMPATALLVLYRQTLAVILLKDPNHDFRPTARPRDRVLASGTRFRRR